MADARLARARTTLPAGYQFGDAGRPAVSPFLGAHAIHPDWYLAKQQEHADYFMRAMAAQDRRKAEEHIAQATAPSLQDLCGDDQRKRDAIESMKRRWGLGR